jgi:hypothetical protein|tara:strand:+ start:16 stop:729 length:714 start_codon:yes stop_codon:yes gene_type:complete
MKSFKFRSLTGVDASSANDFLDASIASSSFFFLDIKKSSTSSSCDTFNADNSSKQTSSDIPNADFDAPSSSSPPIALALARAFNTATIFSIAASHRFFARTNAIASEPSAPSASSTSFASTYSAIVVLASSPSVAVAADAFASASNAGAERKLALSFPINPRTPRNCSTTSLLADNRSCVRSLSAFARSALSRSASHRVRIAALASRNALAALAACHHRAIRQSLASRVARFSALPE